MSERKGKVTVTTEDIFPIIRKWLYTDHDIFVRELVSNGSDAITKLKRIADLGQAQVDENLPYQLEISFDEETGIMRFSDNGIGMTDDELNKYINQIAFSGAMDFVAQFKDEKDTSGGIIGHFGLGFYSSFMVADKVVIDTKSYINDKDAVCWTSTDGMEYTISQSERNERGTTITLHLSDEAKKIFNASSVRQTLKKYCSFITYPLYYHDIQAEVRFLNSQEEKKKEATDKGEAFEEKTFEKDRINPVTPLWQKSPTECTDEDYIQFYHEVFSDMQDPLFWIHLNMDYPFALQGILYFPKTDNIYQSLEGRIKIYNQQVFVADNIEEIIPDFLFLLRGCLDCSDLPLNVSRSALQQDQYVKKLASHIIKKVSDKLTQQFKNDREAYEKYWTDIGVFVKYGMMRDDKFFEKAQEFLLFKTVDHKLMTYKALTEDKNAIRYTREPDRQAAYIEVAKNRGYNVVVLNDEIDNNFISFLEYKFPSTRFMRVDSEFEGDSKSSDDKDAIESTFKRILGDNSLHIDVISLGDDSFPAFIRETEEARRMAEMRKQFERMKKSSDDEDPYAEMDKMFPDKKDLILNADHPLVTYLFKLHNADPQNEQLDMLCQHLYDQARLSHGSLDAEGLKRFIKSHSDLLLKFAENNIEESNES